ncbi:MAG: hypothetical protein P4L82_12315 [Ancalomicrobiaceae bacterium]|nr:hypothetical protein [Ancalomicrobiaceae bacterium]
MKSISILLVAASLSALSTAAFAQPSDSISADIDRQIVLGNVAASNDNLPANDVVGGVVEGRQAAVVTRPAFSAADRQFVRQQDAVDRNKPTHNY